MTYSHFTSLPPYRRCCEASKIPVTGHTTITYKTPLLWGLPSCMPRYLSVKAQENPSIELQHKAQINLNMLFILVPMRHHPSLEGGEYPWDY